MCRAHTESVLCRCGIANVRIPTSSPIARINGVYGVAGFPWASMTWVVPPFGFTRPWLFVPLFAAISSSVTTLRTPSRRKPTRGSLRRDSR
jgi:hypothetical protein